MYEGSIEGPLSSVNEPEAIDPGVPDAGVVAEEDLTDLPLPDEMPKLTRAERRVVSGDFLGTGTLEHALGRERAEEVFARTAIYDRAQRSAAMKLGRRALQ